MLNYFSIITTCLYVNNIYIYRVQMCTVGTGVIRISLKINKNFQEQSSCLGGFHCASGQCSASPQCLNDTNYSQGKHWFLNAWLGGLAAGV